MKYALFVLLWLLPGLLSAANFTARVDRHVLQPGESLQLILELDQPDYFVDPDISPLLKNFTLLSSSHQPLVEENGQSVSRWSLRLQPLMHGKLDIPALQLGELKSAPLQIEVKETADTPESSLEPVYIDASLDHEEHYVQAQALLTVKIYHSVPLYSDGQLSPLTVESARVHSLGEPVMYQQYIQGIRHGVIEMRYAIFPQTSGELQIEPQTFTATLAQNPVNSLELAEPAGPGRKIMVKSARIPLQVKPPPQAFPADATWLPAYAVKLEQQLEPTEAVSAEQAIEYRIKLQVLGQPASALPSLLPAQQQGFRLYESPPFQQQKTVATGIDSEQSEQLLLVARQPGSKEIAALRLPWWNLATNQLEWAEGSAQSIRILPPSDIPEPPLVIRQDSVLPWQLLSAAMSALALLFAILWLKARKQTHSPGEPEPVKAARQQLAALHSACHANQPAAARSTLDAWLRSKGLSTPSLSQDWPELHAAISELNQALYAPNAPDWAGSRLWLAVVEVNNTKQTNRKENLPPLYPA